MILKADLFWQVLKSHTGNPITLSVLFAAVARRLGVSLEPVSVFNFIVCCLFDLIRILGQQDHYKFFYSFCNISNVLLRIIFSKESLVLLDLIFR